MKIFDSNDLYRNLAYPYDRDCDRDLFDRIYRVDLVCLLCNCHDRRHICPNDHDYRRSPGGAGRIDLDHGPDRDRADPCPCCRCACCHSDRGSCSYCYGVCRFVLPPGFSSSPLRYGLA